MSDALEGYSRAVRAFAESIHQARRIAEIVNRGATALRNWEQVQVTDVTGEFPGDVRRDRGSENDLVGRDWPGAQQIADVLLEYHRARRELERAFGAIPEDHRHAVRCPDSVAPPR